MANATSWGRSVDRFQDLRRNLDKTSMTGLEIGPFYSPVAPKADGWKTIVVDFKDGDALRAAAARHPAKEISDRSGAIEDVDIVWSGQPLDEPALALNPAGYNYLIASHVIEHIPDIVRFLQQTERLLKPKGIVSLAVPDMRKCFDALKPPSGIREALQAYRERRVRHTPETLFEARSYSVGRNGEGAWITGTTAPLTFICNMKSAWHLYQQDALVADAPYVDAHAWFFTPASFEALMLELNYLGLVSMKIDFLRENLGSEFIVQMLPNPEPASRLSAEDFNIRRIELGTRRIREMATEILGMS